MVLKVEPMRSAVREAMRVLPPGSRRVYLGADGRRFEQRMAREACEWPGLVLIAGRYEGIDQRFIEQEIDEEWSIGDYVLSGGELAAAVVLDSTMRLLPGVLGNQASSEYESFGLADGLLESKLGEGVSSTHGAGGLLDYPHYTRPAEFRGLSVPEVLSSGNHDQIRRWRREQALRKTLRNRPDLLEGAALSAEDRSYLRSLEVQAGGAQSKDSV
jgi:tRNA (guanine37-N1)-methyltransferase